MTPAPHDHRQRQRPPPPSRPEHHDAACDDRDLAGLASQEGGLLHEAHERRVMGLTDPGGVDGSGASSPGWAGNEACVEWTARSGASTARTGGRSSPRLRRMALRQLARGNAGSAAHRRSLDVAASVTSATLVEALGSGVRFATFFVPAGLGTIESANAAAFAALGWAASDGLAFSLVRRGRQAVWVGLGLALLWPWEPGGPGGLTGPSPRRPAATAESLGGPGQDRGRPRAAAGRGPAAGGPPSRARQ